MFKGPKAILSSAIANALAEYFEVDANQIQSNLLGDANIVLHTVELEWKDTGATIGGVRRSKCHATSWTTMSTRSRCSFHFRLGLICAPTWPPKLLHGIRYYLALCQGGHKEEEYHGALQHPHS